MRTQHTEAVVCPDLSEALTGTTGRFTLQIERSGESFEVQRLQAGMARFNIHVLICQLTKVPQSYIADVDWHPGAYVLVTFVPHMKQDDQTQRYNQIYNVTVLWPYQDEAAAEAGFHSLLNRKV